MIAERKLRRRQLTDTGDVEITGRDLRENTPAVGQGSLFTAMGTWLPCIKSEPRGVACRLWLVGPDL